MRVRTNQGRVTGIGFVTGSSLCLSRTAGWILGHSGVRLPRCRTCEGEHSLGL